MNRITVSNPARRELLWDINQIRNYAIALKSEVLEGDATPENKLKEVATFQNAIAADLERLIERLDGEI